jgi:hypothetical protein
LCEMITLGFAGGLAGIWLHQNLVALCLAAGPRASRDLPIPAVGSAELWRPGWSERVRPRYPAGARAIDAGPRPTRGVRTDSTRPCSLSERPRLRSGLSGTTREESGPLAERPQIISRRNRTTWGVRNEPVVRGDTLGSSSDL